MGTLDEPDGADWIVGYVERAEDVDRTFAKLYAEQKTNRTILGPYRREEQIFWKRYRDAEKQYVSELAVHEYDFDFIHKLGKAHQSAWIRRLDALRDKAQEVARASLDRKPMYRLERVRYYAVVARALDEHSAAIARDVQLGLSSAQIRDEIIAKVGMMADARTPEMQARYDAAVARERGSRS